MYMVEFVGESVQYQAHEYAYNFEVLFCLCQS